MIKVAIHSVPRSGSTWLGNIFNSHSKVSFKMQPLFSYAFKDYLSPNSSLKDINTFFNLIYTSDDAFINQKDAIENGLIPNFNKEEQLTHICYKEVRYHHILENLLEKSQDIKLILLVRNPLSVIHSFKNAPKEFRKEEGWIFKKEWKDAPSKNLNKPEEFYGYNKWKETSTLFLKLKNSFPDNVKLITYSNLLTNTEKMVKDIFEFVSLDLDQQTKKFISQSKSKNSNDPYSVFKIKNVDNEWENNLPVEIIDYIINDLKGTNLNQFLYA